MGRGYLLTATDQHEELNQSSEKKYIFIENYYHLVYSR